MKTEIIDQLIPMAEAHQRADEYVSGNYWSESQHKGCAVGCSIADLKKIGVLNGVNYNDHAALALAIGVPEMLWQLSDYVFEGLPDKERREWTPRFLKAIRASTPERLVASPTMIMSRLAERLAADAIREDVKQACLVGAALWKRRGAGDEPSEEEWNAAWEQACAAREQAYAAREQAYAAWKQADAAREQAYAAWKQAYAAREQAYAAWEQAYAAREQADAAWEQAYAAWEQAYAAREQAYAAREQADAAWKQAYAAWEQAYAAREQAYAAWKQADAAREQWWVWCSDMVVEVLAGKAA